MDNVIIYRTKFKLTNPVNNLEAAREYLTGDNMALYLKEDFPEIAENIISLEWKLEDEEEGNIILKTDITLEEDVLSDISEWISGQCSDGLGEGFEQQDFAAVEDEDDEGYYDYASFDWRTNQYELERIM